MASHELIRVLLEAAIASSAAIVLVLLMRRPLRRAFGARVAYAAWSLVPVALLAVLLPAPASAVAGSVTGTVAALPGQLVSMLTDAETGSDLQACLTSAWLLGAAASALLMLRAQRGFRQGLGELVPRGEEVLLASSTSGLPATLGLWRPRIILPADFEARYCERERVLVLAHERAHIARGDLQANALAAVLRCLFWFNPLLQLAAVRFRHDQELACDASVLAGNARARRDYGEALLATQCAAQASPTGCHFGFGHPLKERITMLKQPLPTALRRIAGSAFVIALASGTGIAVWAAQPVQAAQSSPAVPNRDVGGLALPAPAYPAAALEQKITGRVILIVDVAADGSVAKAVVDRSEPAGVFDETALAAVKKWKFTPAMKDGKPVASRIRIPIDFDTHDPDKKAG